MPLSFITTRSASATVVDVAEVRPSIIFNSAAVLVTPSKILSSAVVAVTPSRRFNSVAVEVTATSSLILGDVRVLFVSVAVEAVETRSTLPPVLGSVRELEAASECGAP